MLNIGDKAEISKTITETDVGLFGAVTGDFNPLHMNAAFAAETQFKQRVVHGAVNSGLISALIGMKLPGPGAIYLGQEVKFKKPTFIGDTITVKGEVVDIKQTSKFPVYILSTNCFNQHGELVTEGIAQISIMKEFLS